MKKALIRYQIMFPGLTYSDPRKFTALPYKDKILIINSDKIYSSYDGVKWTTEHNGFKKMTLSWPHFYRFPKRKGHASVVFNGKVYIIAGYGLSDVLVYED